MSWLFLANLKGVHPNMSQIRPPQEAHALHLALLPPKSADSAGTQLKWTHFQTPVIHRGGHALISLNLSFISSEVRFRDHPKIQDSRLVGWLLLFWGLQTTTWIDFNTLPKCRKLDSSKTPFFHASMPNTKLPTGKGSKTHIIFRLPHETPPTPRCSLKRLKVSRQARSLSLYRRSISLGVRGSLPPSPWPSQLNSQHQQLNNYSNPYGPATRMRSLKWCLKVSRRSSASLEHWCITSNSPSGLASENTVNIDSKGHGLHSSCSHIL